MRRPNRRNFIWGLTGFAWGIACSYVFHAWIAHAGIRVPKPDQVFQRAVQIVLDRYVEPIDAKQWFAQGLKLMVANLDAHSFYVSADERNLYGDHTRDKASTGITVVLQDQPNYPSKQLVITAVAEDSDAARHGLQPGDRIVKLRGKTIEELNNQIEVDMLLLGTVGTTIEMSVQKVRDNEVRPCRIVLAKQKEIATTYAQVIQEQGRRIGLLRIAGFPEGSGHQIKETLQSWLSKSRTSSSTKPNNNLDGIVFDLRGNPGGEIKEALILADALLDSGMLTRIRGRGGQILREEFAHPAVIDLKTPIVILQDRYTASAAELFTAALQDHNRAYVIGDQSYGKGSIQEFLGFKDGSLLRLTTSRYYSPLDKQIDQRGVTPNMHLHMHLHLAHSHQTKREDPGLTAAIDHITGRSKRESER